ncbi:Gfo/Idh/MocA family protein [Aquisphaera insulae]|uniref:Gfo/Idh/MocA family protein n=1 Tax=Aquisphaera insulae TaxID=2712864 RepID=UPI0013EC5DB0|nr:Gfo/Idh/MocA family oxidoreductase [Aquisphaera insulae]
MPPITVNRRRFLGCSAAASLAISQAATEAAAADDTAAVVRVGLVGVGNRGTALLRSLLELPGVSVPAVCDPEPRHRLRGQGIVEKATGRRPEAIEDPRRLIERNDVDAVVVAVPCDLHESIGSDAIRAGRHLYVEKPLALTLPGCDRLILESARRPELAVQVGFQRRSNPRFREGVERVRSGELGPLIEARATWTSSNGPLVGHDGWLGRRDRSGDFMVEQAVHVWDILHWLRGGPPSKAEGWGRKGLFARVDSSRDVTDHYSVELEWPDGFRASFLQSWVSPADDGFTGTTLRVLGEEGGLDLSTGSLSFRDRGRPRQSIHPGPQNDTRLALMDFLASIRAERRLPPPVTLAEAREATLTGLLVRKAVDERRAVTMGEIVAGPTDVA